MGLDDFTESLSVSVKRNESESRTFDMLLIRASQPFCSITLVLSLSLPPLAKLVYTYPANDKQLRIV